MKKIVAIALSMVMVLGMTSMAFASNGKGKGLATAPGQAENFSKGITTVVTTNEVITESKIEDVQTSSESSTETKSETIVTANTIEEEVLVYHSNAHDSSKNQYGWYRYDTYVTTVTTTTIKTWDETTVVTTTTTTVTPVTTTETIETTLQHRGAPGSNGEVISEKSEIVGSVSTSGEASVDTEIDTDVSVGEVATTTSETSSRIRTVEGDWIKN